MGRAGQLSRIQNEFLTPVSHPSLPFKAAPGQLSAAEIRTALSLHGFIPPLQYHLFGKPITQSKSPAMHNAAFRATGLPHTYSLFETDTASNLSDTLRSPSFGGASITIPLKLSILPFLDSISQDAQIIGAVNTIIADPPRKSTKDPDGHHLTGRNTDWLGMSKVLTNAGARPGQGQSGLVIGGGGTARAAIYTLHALKYSPIYVLGRSQVKIQELVSTFPEEYDLKPLITISEAQSIPNDALPTIAIDTIPADKPIDPGMQAALEYIFSQAKGGILLEMAYKPAVTPLMQLAKGWKTIPGLEVLAGQAYYQFKAWTGIWPLFEGLRRECGVI